MLTWEVEGDSGQPELVEAARIRRRAVAVLLGKPRGRGRRAVAVLLGVRARPGPRSRRGRRRRSSWAGRAVLDGEHVEGAGGAAGGGGAWAGGRRGRRRSARGR